MLIEQIEKMLSGQTSREDTGWWAYDILLEKPAYERGFEKLLEDIVWALHYCMNRNHDAAVLPGCRRGYVLLKMPEV